MKRAKQIHGWLIAGYVLAIMAMSVAPINSNKLASLSSSSVLNVRSDYLLHALLFVPWMILALWKQKENNKPRFFMKALATGFLLAFASEAVQYGLPYRAFNWIDLAANCVGVAVGGVLGWGIARQGVRGKG